MSKWYIVKKNWKTINKGYLGLGGDTWADIQIPLQGKLLLKRILANRKYVEFSGLTFLVVTDYSMAKEYYLYQKQLNLDPIMISATDDIDIHDVDGYDFGNPAGGYSVIESAILVQNNEMLKKEFLNEHFLFKDMDKLKDFLDLCKNADNVEELTCYRAVAIKKIVIE